MSKTKQIVFKDISVRFARVFEENRDMGDNLPEGSDAKMKIEETQGKYAIDLPMSREYKQQMIQAGIPNKGMLGQLWKEDSDGEVFYKATRKHFNPKLRDKETSDYGVVQGPPKVVMAEFNDEGKIVSNRPWVFKDEDGEFQDGYLGNESICDVRVSVWDDKIVTLEAILVKEHIEFEPEGNGEWF